MYALVKMSSFLRVASRDTLQPSSISMCKMYIRLLKTTKSYAYPYCTRGRGWATRDGRRATPPSTCGPASHLPTALSSVFLTLLGTHCHSPAPVPCHATAHASAQRSITLAPFRVPVGGRDVPRCHAAHGAPRSEFIHTHAPNMYCADHLLALTGHVPSTSEKLGSSCRQSA